MSFVNDIATTWSNPAIGVRQHFKRPRSEPFLFTFLFVFLLLTFVGMWPQAARAAYFQPEAPLEQRLLAAALALCASIPFWYALAALSQLVAGLFGGQGDYYHARLALFWALACTGPLTLLVGMVQGFVGPGLQTNATGIAVGLAFVWLWFRLLVEVQRR